MRQLWFRILFSFSLFIFLLAGCNGDAEEQATAQAVIQELVSTNTPPPTATPSPPPPTDTPTPVPPTPSATPPPPTESPTPVSPTPLALPEQKISDELQDTYNCDTQVSVEDPEVDIASFSALQSADNLTIDVFLVNPLVNDYSFAVLLTLDVGDNFNYYIWEIHETVQRVGQIDAQTGELSSESGQSNLLINHDLDLGQVTFTIPTTRTVTISTTTAVSFTTVISGTNAPLEQLYIASFHTPQAGSPKNCDTVGPVNFALSLPEN